MLKIEGKTFMNIQEAVQWLLDNNALPFQSSANYQANTEIGLGTIVNPSPAKVRIGSLIFFADSKVSTVVGITETGFICSDQYNDLVDDIVYVSNVALNVSGHLIVTLSNGDTIDAGLIKQVSSFSINASQHLIALYNDGTTTDLGAIFSGDVNIAGNLTATTLKQANANYSNPISPSASGGLTTSNIYSRAEEINNMLYIVSSFEVKNETASPITVYQLGSIYIALSAEIADKIVDMAGHKATIADASECNILYFEGYLTNDLTGIIQNQINCRLVNSNSANQVRVMMNVSGGLTVPAGESRYISLRTFLTLL